MPKFLIKDLGWLKRSFLIDQVYWQLDDYGSLNVSVFINYFWFA
jgi:hypothetical protein